MERSARTSRYRLFDLWISQASRLMADFALFAILAPLPIVFRETNGIPKRPWTDTDLGPWFVEFVLPVVLLAPIIGWLSNDFSKRIILIASSAYSFLIAACCTTLIPTNAHFTPWQLAWTGIFTGAALFSSAKYALLPAVSQDARLPLSRVVALIDSGGALGIFCGVMMAFRLWRWIFMVIFKLDRPWEDRLLWFLRLIEENAGSVQMFAVIVLCVISLAWALLARFPSDLALRPSNSGLAGFFRDSKIILATKESRRALLGQAVLMGLVWAIIGAMFAEVPEWEFPVPPKELSLVIYVVGGGVFGCLLAGIQGHPQRILGLVPIAGTGSLILYFWAITNWDSIGPCLTLGLFAGLINVPLRAKYLAVVPANSRGNATALMHMLNYSFGSLLLLMLLRISRISDALNPAWFFGLLIPLAVMFSWRVFFRECLEQLIEILIWPVYRIRAYGPGKDEIPAQGPLIIVANHTSWFDPIWLGKVVPRLITPMMTSRFHDLPVLRWLMVHVVHAVRVQISRYRREVPELGEAIAALDRGECVVVFPEGFMRRREDRPLRRFGQGVWHILSKRPTTPVIVCWIEGGWGSYFSYAGGPPTKNKRFDFWRRIQVAMEAPQTLDPALLKDQRTTRTYLMRVCLEARRHLGLQPLAQLEAIATEESEDEVEG